MKSKSRTIRVSLAAVCLMVCAAGGLPSAAGAQQVQIPTLQVCNQTSVTGKAVVRIMSRSDASHSGIFEVAVELSCTPPGYPSGSVTISTISMNDTLAASPITSTGIDQVTSTGKYSPTAYISGRCKAENVKGCHFWMMFADNKPGDKEGTPDIVGFLVFDGTGHRVAYGTGPVLKGDIKVAPTGN